MLSVFWSKYAGCSFSIRAVPRDRVRIRDYVRDGVTIERFVIECTSSERASCLHHIERIVAASNIT